MKTMIWKELRENLKWAALGLICLLLAELYSLSSQRGSNGEDYRNLTLCASGFLLVTSFGCSVLGVALACVQILPELRRDQWAALLHRPVTRSVIFFGKIFAGLLLCLGATMLPFVVCAGYAATPGQFAGPLVPEMLLPGLSDIILGLAFYCGGMLLCLHRAHWFGGRGIIALSLAMVFVLHITAGWSAVLTFVAALIYLLAARGALLSNATLENRPWPDRAALAIVFLGGTEAILLFVFYGLQFVPGSAGVSPQAYVQFAITRDEQVFIVSENGDGSGVVLTDTKGNTIADQRYLRSQDQFCESLPLSFGADALKPSVPAWGTVERETGNYVEECEDFMSRQIWYKLQRKNYFIGYDKLSRRCVGYYDAEGYQASDAKPKPFAEPIQRTLISFRTPHLYSSGSTLYALDFLDRNAVTFALSGETIFGALDLSGNFGEKPAYVAVALKNHLRVFDFHGALVMDIPYPHDPATWSSLSVTASPDRIFLESSPVTPPYYKEVRPVTNEPVYLDEIDLRGNILHTYHRANMEYVPPPPRLDARLAKWTLPVVPVLARVAYLKVFPLPETSFGFYGWPSVLAPGLGLSVTDLAMPLMLGVVAGIGVFAWMRRVGFGAGEAIGGALFAFCFGIPGLVALRLAVPWPQRVSCPDCGRKRDVEKELCPSCAQAWPAIPATGTEIIDGVNFAP